MLGGHPVKTSRGREFVPPLAGGADVEALLLGAAVCRAVKGIARQLDVHAGDVRGRLADVEAGLDRGGGVLRERDGADDVTFGDVVVSAADGEVAGERDGGDVEPLAPPVRAAQLQLVDEVVRVVDRRLQPAPSRAVLALRLGAKVFVTWWVAAEIVLAAGSSAAGRRAFWVLGMSVASTVALLLRAAGGLSAGACRVVASVISLTTLWLAFLIHLSIASAAVAFCFGAAVWGRVVAAPGGVTPRLARTAHGLALVVGSFPIAATIGIARAAMCRRVARAAAEGSRVTDILASECDFLVLKPVLAVTVASAALGTGVGADTDVDTYGDGIAADAVRAGALDLAIPQRLLKLAGPVLAAGGTSLQRAILGLGIGKVPVPRAGVRRHATVINVDTDAGRESIAAATAFDWRDGDAQASLGSVPCRAGSETVLESAGGVTVQSARVTTALDIGPGLVKGHQCFLLLAARGCGALSVGSSRERG